MTYSFDIFDTCLVRKCGTPYNMLDVLSLRVFKVQVEESVRQAFVVSRKKAETEVWNKNPFGKLSDIYEAMDFTLPSLHSVTRLVEIETALETELLVPVLKMRQKIDGLRAKGNHIIYISDMYLPESVIRKRMVECGFLKDGDTIYISCEVGRQKQDGSLFRYVKDKECLHWKQWKHFGDNKLHDVDVPRKLGMSAERVEWKYNPYPAAWIRNDRSPGFKYPSIIAGLCRALCLSNGENSHKNFVADIVAPFYSSWVYRILTDASSRGIRHLFFCSRDACQIYRIALQMLPQFKDMKVSYLYISRTALYRKDNEKDKIGYYEKVGLATKAGESAIVDTTTSGKTLRTLNDLLARYGYGKIKGYYFFVTEELNVDPEVYINICCKPYLSGNERSHIEPHNPYWIYLFESSWSANSEACTVSYKNSTPVLSDNEGDTKDDGFYDDGIDWETVHTDLLRQFSSDFISLGLGRYSKECFDNVAFPAFCSFYNEPEKYYLPSIEHFCYRNEKGKVLPYIKKHSFYSIYVRRKRDFLWREGTVAYSMPKWFLQLRSFYRRSREQHI